MQKHITIGVAGRVDHGKTSLIMDEHILNEKSLKVLSPEVLK